MMPQNHQMLHELQAICKCYGINQGKAVIAFELYMELCEVHKLWDVEHHFHEKFNMFYFTAKSKQKDENCTVYIPVTTHEIFSMKYIEDLQTTLSPIHKSLVLVFKDQDSSSTHYRVTNGLRKPDSPAVAQLKKIEEKRTIQYKKCLKKWQKKLYSNALEDKNS